MLVRQRMSGRLVAARPQDPVEHATELMARHGFRHLPVLRGGRLIGIVSDRDLRGVQAATKCVQDVMTLNPISISPDDSVDEAACIMLEHKISALPVAEKNRVVGILTTSGILQAFVDLSGVAELTTRIILNLKDGRGSERKVREIVHGCHAELKWIHREGRRLDLRVKARHVDEVVTALEAAGFDVTAVVASSVVSARARGGTKPSK